MLNEQDIRIANRRRMWLIGPAFAVGVCSILAYVFVVQHFRPEVLAFAFDRWGETGRNVAGPVLMLPAFALFLIPLIVIDPFVNRHKIVCPVCTKDISSQIESLLLTRCCPRCDARIVEGGRERSKTVYRRRQRWKTFAFLRRWLWTWPGFGGVMAVVCLINPSSLDKCSQVLWLPALIGTLTAGWVFMRTSDRRYLPQFFTSLALFGIGGYLFYLHYW